MLACQRSSIAAIVLSLVGLVGCQVAPTQQVEAPSMAAVAMPDSHSAAAAEQILEAGGNAVDAAVAAAFVLAVTYPEAGNIGGGGFMLTFVDGESDFLDYREVAPQTAHRDMYLDEEGNVIDGLSLVGALAAGVPGTVAGLWEAHQRYGTRPWAELLTPAITLARNGFVMPEQLARRIERKIPAYEGKTNFDLYFGTARANQRFQQPVLATTLERVAAAGRDGFYRGATARAIAETSRQYGGLISEEDLDDYRAIWRPPIRNAWRDLDVVASPPPSSGGFAVVQLLKMRDALGEAVLDAEHHSTAHIHLVAEIEKRVFADRAEYLGDPDYYDVPIDALLADDYIERRAGEVNHTAISTLDSVPPGLDESPDTTHFSILDRWGNAVSQTYTLNTSFGSGLVVEGGGFLLNNEMDDFSAKPGVPNVYGVVGHEANAIQPGKRMLSSMSPTLLLRDGEIAMVVGSPGGSTIFTSVFQTIVNIIDYGMSAQEAVSATRFHHQLLPPDRITFSPGRPLPAATVSELETIGYRVVPHPWDFGDVQVIDRTGDDLQVGTDPRGRGAGRVIASP